MLPPATVLTNRICGVSPMQCLLVAAACVWICGCTPPGPRALLQGKKLIDAGHYREAVAKLEKAATLLPKSALAWNYLGLAYHLNQQPEQATKAYRIALSLDHKLSAVRYNLGALYLEQNDLPAAIDELRSYTLLQPNVLEGWLKLGTAFARAHRPDEAERSFRTALELHPKHPEALNGLGLVQIQRHRWQDALSQFNLAALQQPPYAPAVLNSAVVTHQYLNNRPAALQRYRQYLGLQPRPADWQTVETTARLLEQELNPPPAAARTTPAPAPAPAAAPPPTNAIVAQTSPASRLATATAPVPPPTSSRTNVSPPASSPKPATPAAPTTTAVPIANAKPSPEPPRLPARPLAIKAAEVPAPRPPELEVTQVASAFVVKPAQDLAPAPTSPAPDLATTDASPAATARSPTEMSKRSFLSRLNPFGGKTKSAPGTMGPETDPSTPPAEAVAPAPQPQIPRYAYLSPARPSAGDRTAAEAEFKRGVKAQKDGHRAQAVAAYQAAVNTDPGFYDAYYNLGLAALDGGDVRLSLWAYEIALALKPDAADARYNFALALKAGGYWQDAADQLQRMLGENPTDARVHLSLANLYAQQLQQPRLARDHYQRVLELNPRHPEAAKIRYWLAANP